LPAHEARICPLTPADWHRTCQPSATLNFMSLKSNISIKYTEAYSGLKAPTGNVFLPLASFDSESRH